MLLKYCRPVGYPGDLQVHPRVDPYPYFATRYGYVLNPQLSKPAGNNPGIDWVNPRQTLRVPVRRATEKVKINTPN